LVGKGFFDADGVERVDNLGDDPELFEGRQDETRFSGDAGPHGWWMIVVSGRRRRRIDAFGQPATGQSICR
jgi:hypothetical protein